MKNHMHGLAISRGIAALIGALFIAMSASVSATTLTDIFQVAEQINQSATRSQAKIDALNEEMIKDSCSKSVSS